MAFQTIGMVVLSVIAVVVTVMVLGVNQWARVTRKLRARLAAARLPVCPQRVNFGEIERLPPPVQTYFRTALNQGQPMIRSVYVRHRGTFNVGEETDQWKPFTSEQQVVAQRPGFDWNGCIAIMPGVPVCVHDAYIAGEGVLQASLLGLLPLANLRGVGDLAAGELMRFVAEAAWYPTVLLPSQGLHWQPVDERSAQATLTEGSIAVTLQFTFNEAGLIETIRAETRGRMVRGQVIPTPWQGRFWNYSERNQMQVPLNGEVAWLLPTGAKPYWRGQITDLSYEFVGERQKDEQLIIDNY